jgi:hypothetical protein
MSTTVVAPGNGARLIIGFTHVFGFGVSLGMATPRLR